MNEKLSKTEKRIQRAALKAKKDNAKKLRLSRARPDHPNKSLRIPNPPATTEKIPKTLDSSSFYPLNFNWCCTSADTKDCWSWGETRQWSDKEWESEIKLQFLNYESCTWGYLCNNEKVRAKGGKQVPKHHSQEVHTLIKEARDRWLQLGHEQHDTVFRFRFSSTKRAWGIRVRGHFHMIWWERHHRIYPTSKSRT